MGDFNLPCISWEDITIQKGHSKVTTDCAKTLLTFMEKNFLSQYVDVKTRQNNILDLCLMNTDRLVLQVNSEPTKLSDHKFLFQGAGEAAIGIANLIAMAMEKKEGIPFDEGIKKMAESEIAAVLLPTTALQLKLKPPPTRKMIDNGCIVALGSDFNPNAHCLNMPLVLYRVFFF